MYALQRESFKKGIQIKKQSIKAINQRVTAVATGQQRSKTAVKG